jgi:hypothetical protein
MSTSRSLRRSLLALLVAGGAATGAVALAASPAGAQVHPRIAVYHMTPTESFNVCGGSNAVIDFGDDTVVFCATGDVHYPVS